MGCDVHMYVEKYNNNTKSWESVGKKFRKMVAYDPYRIMSSKDKWLEGRGGILQI